MAGWRQAIELTLSDEEIAALTISRSRTCWRKCGRGCYHVRRWAEAAKAESQKIARDWQLRIEIDSFAPRPEIEQRG